MSEFESGSSKKGFVRDVMRRISSSAPRGEGPSGQDPDGPQPTQDEIEDLRDAARLFGADSGEFRRRFDRLLAEHEAMRRRYQLTRDPVTDEVA